jgi:DNA-binding transcriptional LysR family regulator
MAVDLNLVRAFIAVHDSGSFSAAAEQFGVPRSTISRAVSALEEELGLALFHRTTRRVATTAAGSALYHRVVRPLGALEASLADLPERREEPSGVLRVTATTDIATVLLAEAVARFSARYPNVQVEMLSSNTILDVVSEQIDLALRIVSGPLRGAALVSRKIGTVTVQLFASPAYLARAGTPRTIEELSGHERVAFRGVPLQPPVTGREKLGADGARITCDDMFFAREVIRHGAGIAGLPGFLAEPDLQSGALVRVLPKWQARAGTVYLVQPSRKHVPSKVTAFRDLLLELLKKRTL